MICTQRCWERDSSGIKGLARSWLMHQAVTYLFLFIIFPVFFAFAALLKYLDEVVVCHNTMVDRITAQRPGSDGDVPRAEPLPAKALVIEDLKGVSHYRSIKGK
jgi:ABC-type glycerol-3-phosphate transport system permease component